MVRAFEEGRIQFLICTSTLIEGVNTQAKNVVVLDNKIARRRIDFFTFNNILGRGGRMFRYFTGRVFLFHDQPTEELFKVDIPILTQGEEVSTGLLLHVDEGDLRGGSERRLEPLLQQHLLPRAVLEANTGIDPEKQIELAEELDSDPMSWHEVLGWRGNPELARKLMDDLRADGDLDLVLERLLEIDPGRGDLSEFEVELLTEAQNSL